jgi:hypothetical protein
MHVYTIKSRWNLKIQRQAFIVCGRGGGQGKGWEGREDRWEKGAEGLLGQFHTLQYGVLFLCSHGLGMQQQLGVACSGCCTTCACGEGCSLSQQLTTACCCCCCCCCCA